MTRTAAEAGIGHNVPPDYTTEERKEDFVRETALYVGSRRVGDAFARDELAQLEGIQRHLALSKNLILGASMSSRRWPQDSCRFAVFTLISLLSDNAKGACLLSQVRMAEVLGRSERRISAAIDELDLAGLICVERTDGGLPKAYWPNVPRILAELNPASTWFVDALSDAPPPRGRPRLVPSGDGRSERPSKINSPRKYPDGCDKIPGRIPTQDISKRSLNSAEDQTRTPESSNWNSADGVGAPATHEPRKPLNTGGLS